MTLPVWTRMRGTNGECQIGSNRVARVSARGDRNRRPLTQETSADPAPSGATPAGDDQVFRTWSSLRVKTFILTPSSTVSKTRSNTETR